MSLIKTGGGITDIRGSFGGVYFTRDKSGLHSSAKPRRVHQQTAAQKKQRDAFSKARAACLTVSPVGKPYDWLNRWVSYYTYRALNNLPFIFDAIVTGTLIPDGTGTYELADTYNDRPWYLRADTVRRIWWSPIPQTWINSEDFTGAGPGWGKTDPNIEGNYIPYLGATGIATVTLSLRPPPDDYQIPTL